MKNRLKIILIGVLVAAVGVSLMPTTPAHAAWPHPAPHGQFDASGYCNGYTNTVKGTWGFTGLLNSPLPGGDTYKLRFKAYTVGAGYSAWTPWYGPYAVRQSPGFNWVPLSPVFYIQRGVWTAVYMDVYSAKTGKIAGDWLKQDRAGGELSEVSPDGLYCKALG
jgi:hypothetical protein